MTTFIIIFFGLCIGSFIACQYDRVRDGWTLRDILNRPSRCASCDAPLKPWHNIPVISYVVQGGRCAFCKARIPWHLPLIELGAAVAFVAVAHLLGVI